MLNLFYMARPIYGGWVSFTAHLALKHDLPLYKIGNKTEEKGRDYGYGVQYRNLAVADLKKLDGKLLITAIDKNYYEALDKFPDGTYIVIHDPTEVKPNASEPVLRNLKRFKVITIRASVQKYLAGLGVKSKFLVHPFFEYDFEKDARPRRAVSISRVDFDKHTEIILDANKKLGASAAVDIYGAINRQYVFFKLADYPFKKYYKGQFEKSFEALSDILADAKYVVDMSVIKHDGGGSQYTFLEAIYQECALVLNKKWVEGFDTVYVDGKNCFVVGDGDELAALLRRDPSVTKLNKEARKLLKPHIDVNWVAALARY
jgi:hypothetical protein